MAHIKKGIFPYKLKYQGFNELLNKRNFQVLDQNNKKKRPNSLRIQKKLFWKLKSQKSDFVNGSFPYYKILANFKLENLVCLSGLSSKQKKNVQTY